MIIVIGLMGEEPVRLLCGRLTALGYDYTFIDESRIPEGVSIHQDWSARGAITGTIRTGNGPSFDVDQVTGVYIRHSDYDNDDLIARQVVDPGQIGMIKAERHKALSMAFDALPCVVINRMNAMFSNDSKPVQSLIARAFGFRVPRTLMTSDPDAALEFREKCDGRIVFKPLGGVRVKVGLVSDEDVSRIHHIRNCPVMFQEFVEGPNYRVHVVGSQLFVTKIVSKGVDYRYASNRYEEAELPSEVAERCLQITRYFGLHMSGIDLIHDGDDFHFLECNPSPAYSFFEIRGFQAISTAMADLLRDGRAEYEAWRTAEPVVRDLTCLNSLRAEPSPA